ncbi:MAG: polysaccharide biosynthesis/export family protein [Halocynthiibacter sp.]
MRFLTVSVFTLFLAGCGSIYQSPAVQSGATGASKVRVIAITAENVLVANRAAYRPLILPTVFSQTAGGGGGLRGAGAIPEPAFEAQQRPRTLETRLPPEVVSRPYMIGVGDVVLLATPQAASTVAELSGLLAAQNRRQGYTVQDDGAIAIPDVGRIMLAGLTLEEAEAEVFQRLVENQINPAFSLEISEFNSRRVSIGGSVRTPAVIPIALTPLYLDGALAATGGVTVPDDNYATIRLYRDGTLYQIPLSELFARSGLRRIRLVAGDSLFVDTEFELDQASAYFEEQIRLAEFRQRARQNALTELNAEVSLRRGALQEARQNYQAQLTLGAVDRDYVYLTGEVGSQSRYVLPFNQTASLADALFDAGGGIPTRTGNVAQIYVLRGSSDPREFSAITAWQLDARNAANLLLGTRFEVRPNDVIFVAEQPVTRWNRVVQQIVPALITSSVAAAAN